ncbi:hypothetical protein B0A52_05679 [Exophiala mesophila]|uniref:Uncharacterized protein n=1 Tax=Exophiala mesophila TaxID=212818 RepID=A0A438N2H5_EXOME|nr:hypothetical protein B0A52_05679 [Exophiala mesophila]
MAKGWLISFIVAISSLVQLAQCRTSTSPSHPTLLRRLNSTVTNDACGQASSAYSSFRAAYPTATTIVIDAELAYDCLHSIPNYQEPALRLLNSLRTYLEFHSSKDILKSPPNGYLFPDVDLDYGFDLIRQNVEAAQYQSEYEFQLDITTLLLSARDGHLTWKGDLIGVFTFVRSTVGAGLVSISSDGQETPQVYMSDDIVQFNPQSNVVQPITGFTPSPVLEIDGVDVNDFLLEQSLVHPSQDPDSLWNQVFFQLGRQSDSTFVSPVFYPGPHTNLTFVNGTTRQFPNQAIVNVPLEGLATGEEGYEAFCPGANGFVTETTSVVSTPTTLVESEVETETSVPASPKVPLSPNPVIKHSADSVAGYYLSDPSYADVAVLKITEFESLTSSAHDYQEEFQQVVEKFLSAAVRSKKRKLIIDLQGNSGGYIDLGTDTFAQLFPSMPPNSKSDMRAHLGLEILGNAASQNISAVKKTDSEEDDKIAKTILAPLAYQTIVDPNLRAFPNFEAVYGPFERNGSNFTAFFQNNYTNVDASDAVGSGVIITGTQNRTGFRRPFAPQDMIVLHDGLCASTCSVFSEYLKNYAGVQFISIGGRPQTGPMQAVGGTKGSQAFTYQSAPDSGLLYPHWNDLFYSPNNVFRDSVNGTIWENFTADPVLRSFGLTGGSVNGRNHYRIGDKSATPLQFVYEASDCRLWWTREMLYDPAFLWRRLADVAFRDRRGKQFNSKYCVRDSTGHPTSISGGWKPGTLGPQSPPETALSTDEGWKVQGTPLTLISGGSDNATLVTSNITGASDSTDSTNSTLSLNGTTIGGTDLESNSVVKTSGQELNSMVEACHGYNGDKWFVQLMCNALDHVAGGE